MLDIMKACDISSAVSNPFKELCGHHSVEVGIDFLVWETVCSYLEQDALYLNWVTPGSEGLSVYPSVLFPLLPCLIYMSHSPRDISGEIKLSPLVFAARLIFSLILGARNLHELSPAQQLTSICFYPVRTFSN
jgi:hypothetical protein